MTNRTNHQGAPPRRLSEHPPRPDGAWFWRPIFLAVFSALFALTDASRAADTPPEAYSRLYFAIQPPQDRDTQRSVELIEELLDSGRFGEAAPLMDRVFAGEIDYLDSSGVSLRDRLLKAALGADPRGRRIIRSILDGAYQRGLDEAATAERLGRVIARYPPELFDEEALIALARVQEDAGAYSNAVATWSYAERVARGGGRDAQAELYSKAAAASALRAGRPVADVLDKSVRDTLSKTQREHARHRSPASWTGPGGDLQRRAWGGGAAPIGWPAWRAVVESPGLSLQGPHPMAPTGGLAATQGLLLAPTPTGLVAFSAESGKRLWRAGADRPAGGSQRFAAYDRARGGIATDGRLAFVVEPTTHGDARRRAREQGLLFTGGRTRSMPANALVAYDLARQGKLAWRWDGGADPDTKAALLGPPAVTESRLYALAEIDQSVCLLTFDTASGEVLANQPLVRCERGFPPYALTIGVTPSVGDRLVYCPTGRGAVAAYDPLLRRLEWVHYLEVDEGQATPRRRNVWNGLGRRGPEEGDAWKHCRLVLRDDRVVVVSPALATMEALDAASGEVRWREPVEAGLFLAGIEGDRVLALERTAAIARDLQTGETRWRAEWPEGDSPVGEAVWLDNGCLAPLRSGALAWIEQGRIETVSLDWNPLETPATIGGVIVHRGAVYSRSDEAITCLRQPSNDSDREPADRSLRDLIAGDRETAVERLRGALLKRPGDKRLSEHLAAALLSDGQLTDPEASELRQRVSGPEARAYAAYYRTESARRRVDPEAVRLHASPLLENPTSEVLLEIEPGLDVRARRIAGERLGRLAERTSIALGERHEKPTKSWSSVLIEAEAELVKRERTTQSMSSRRREPALTVQPLPFSGGATRGASLGHWSVEFHNGEPIRLVAHNRWGERAFNALAPSDSSVRGRRPQQTVGLPSDALWGDWIALRLDEGYAVYRHAAASEEGETPLVWTSQALTDQRGGPREESPIPEQLYALGPWGVISVAGDRLVCRDLATGQLQWRRRLESLREESPRLLVSGDDLLIAGPSGQGLRLSAMTGETRSRVWLHPPAKSWRALAETAGGEANLLIERRTAGGREHRLISVGNPETPLWSSQPGANLFTAATPEGLFATLDEELRLTLVDLKTGEERFTTLLSSEDERPVRELRIETRGARLLVEVDRTNQMIDRAVGVSGLAGRPMLTGELHCLDPKTGEPLWAGPAEIEALSRLPIPVRDAPVLFYGRRTASESESPDAEQRLSLVAIDLGTGGAIYRNHTIPAGDPMQPTTRFRVQSEADGQLLVRVGRMWLRLTPTDRPAPPRPPTLARVEDPATSQPKDMGRSVERLFNSFWDDP